MATNHHELRESALSKIDSDEAVALLGPFIEAAVASSSSTASSEPKWRGPKGEKWTLGEWMLYVSKMLQFGTDDDFAIWFRQQTKLAEEGAGGRG